MINGPGVKPIAHVNLKLAFPAERWNTSPGWFLFDVIKRDRILSLVVLMNSTILSSCYFQFTFIFFTSAVYSSFIKLDWYVHVTSVYHCSFIYLLATNIHLRFFFNLNFVFISWVLDNNVYYIRSVYHCSCIYIWSVTIQIFVLTSVVYSPWSSFDMCI